MATKATILSSFLMIFSLTVILSCGEDKTQSTKQPDKSAPSPKLGKIAPLTDNTYTIGDTVHLKLTDVESELNEIQVFLNEQSISTLDGPDSLMIPTANGKLGQNTIKLSLKDQKGQSQNLSTAISLISDITPKKLSYALQGVYEHDQQLFTQGFNFDQGSILESTGLKGQSLIRRYDLQSGQIQQEVKLDNEFFGEGCVVFGERLFLLTYQNNQIFVYNKDNFEFIGEFFWPNEGWGLTRNEAELILSDGSSNIYFFDPENLVEKRRIQVSNEKGFIEKINELEYVDGLLLANIWQTDTIIGIDPMTGKVLYELNMRGILPGYESENQPDHVLNGIAYRPDHKSLLITGKKWPRIFEIAVPKVD